MKDPSQRYAALIDQLCEHQRRVLNEHVKLEDWREKMREARWRTAGIIVADAIARARRQ